MRARFSSEWLTSMVAIGGRLLAVGTTSAVGMSETVLVDGALLSTKTDVTAMLLGCLGAAEMRLGCGCPSSLSGRTEGPAWVPLRGYRTARSLRRSSCLSLTGSSEGAAREAEGATLESEVAALETEDAVPEAEDAAPDDEASASDDEASASSGGTLMS